MAASCMAATALVDDDLRQNARNAQHVLLEIEY